MPPRKNSASSDMRYACDQPGCTKSYSRPDHLLRHKLNHVQDRVLSCDQCDRTFVRQDLLIRHLERHALRGKTLGRWSNRSKENMDAESDNDEDASISRPDRQRRRDSNSERSQLHSTSSDNSRQDQLTVLQRTKAEIIEPLTSANHGSMSGTHSIHSGWSVLDPNQHVADPLPIRHLTSHQPSAAWPHLTQSDTYESASQRAPLPPMPSAVHRHSAAAIDSLVAPNSSFLLPPHPAPPNLGFTVQKPDNVWVESPSNSRNNDGDASGTPFRWVPPEDPIRDVGRGSYAPPPSSSYYAAWNEASSHHRSDPPPLTSLQTTSTARNHTGPTPTQDIFPFAPPNTDHAADYGWLFDGVDPFMASQQRSMNAADSRAAPSQTSAFSPSSSDGVGGFFGNINGTQNGNWHGSRGDASSFHRGMSSDGHLVSGSEAESPNALEDLAFFASLQAEIPNRPAFNVDAVAHHRLLIFLQSVSELPNSSLFAPSALRCYVYLFFVKFNRLYPLIHEPTFAASTTDSMLLSAIIVIGAHFAALPAHEMAVRIAQKIWGAIVSLEDFRPARATLPMLQAMVLTEAFGKMMSTRPQHEMAHLFHNFIVTLARRNAVFNASAMTQVHHDNTEESWRSWAREEEKKRIALFEFMLDAQHATSFRQIPSMSSFQIQLNLPCKNEEWIQINSDSWYKYRRRASYKPPTPFIPALKACLSQSKTPPELDAFSRFVLLHGLMSIAYDLQWKQDVLLGAESSPGGSKGDNVVGNWKKRLSAAYSSLRAHMEAESFKGDEASSASYIYRGTPSLVTAAQIALFADMIDVQIYAGLPSVLGRFIDRATFNASRRSVKEWARSAEGRTAVWCAVNFLRMSLLDREPRFSEEKGSPSHGSLNAHSLTSSGARRALTDQKTGVDELLHHRWCQYHCALVIWAYGHALTPHRLGLADTASSTRPGSAHRTTMPQLSELSAPVPGPDPEETLDHRSKYTLPNTNAEGADFLVRMSTKTAEDIARVDCKCNTKGVLEMVEKELRGSRWELGREASGVLRKLISNHLQSSDRGTGAVQPESDNHTLQSDSDLGSGSTKKVHGDAMPTQRASTPQREHG